MEHLFDLVWRSFGVVCLRTFEIPRVTEFITCQLTKKLYQLCYDHTLDTIHMYVVIANDEKKSTFNDLVSHFLLPSIIHECPNLFSGFSKSLLICLSISGLTILTIIIPIKFCVFWYITWWRWIMCTSKSFSSWCECTI